MSGLYGGNETKVTFYQSARARWSHVRWSLYLAAAWSEISDVTAQPRHRHQAGNPGG